MAQTHGKVVGVLLMNKGFGPRLDETLDAPQREVTYYWQVASPRAPLVICPILEPAAFDNPVAVREHLHRNSTGTFYKMTGTSAAKVMETHASHRDAIRKVSDIIGRGAPDIVGA